MSKKQSSPNPLIMKNAFKITLLSGMFGIIFLSAGCSKSSTTSPITQIQQAAGLPTMSATCNGTVVTFAGIQASYAGGRYTITAAAPGQTSSTNTGVILYTNLNRVGTATLNGASTTVGNTGVYAFGPSDTSAVQYWTDATHTGILNITAMDTAKKVLSGNFNFQAIQFHPTGTTNTVTVTNGTFSNVKW